MKKIVSLLLVLAMVLSMGVTSAFAAEIDGNWGDGTAVVYNADETATEYYTVTVPASLDPGDSGTVTAEGNFPSHKTLKVTADTSVVLTDGISTKTLGVAFTGIELAGSDTATVSASNSVAIANWSDEVKAPLFGEWEGTFYYDVEMVDTVKETATLTLEFYDGDITITYEPGMTWAEWIESEYNLTVDLDGIDTKFYYYDGEIAHNAMFNIVEYDESGNIIWRIGNDLIDASKQYYIR